MNQLTAVFLGPQGCGKGTQIALLKEFLSTNDAARPVVHFEMGKQLRELASRDGYTPQKVRQVLADGELISYFISSAQFSNYLIDHMHGNEHLIVDGFPRQADQVPALHSAMEFYNREKIFVLCINISDDEAVARLLKRGRHDDTEESIRHRLRWSREETIPNIAWFRTQPLYEVIDVDGERSAEEVQADIRARLGLAAAGVLA